MEESNYAQRLRFLETTDLLPPCNPGHSTQEDRLLSRGQADAIANATGSLKHCLQPVHSCAAIGGAMWGPTTCYSTRPCLVWISCTIFVPAFSCPQSWAHLFICFICLSYLLWLSVRLKVLRRFNKRITMYSRTAYEAITTGCWCKISFI